MEVQPSGELDGRPAGRLLKLRPPRIAMMLMAVAALLHFVSPAGTIVFLPFLPAGIAIAAAGFGMMMWSWSHFRRHETVICPTGKASFLIREAPYTFSRNPMYLGMVMMLLGGAFMLGSIVAFIAPAGFFILMSEVFIPFEEINMQSIFGADYENYRQRVRRWL